MKGKKLITGLLVFTGLIGGAATINNVPANAKSSKHIQIISQSGHKVPFSYSSKKSKTINAAHQYTETDKDWNYGTASLKLKSITYYKLKSNQYHKRINVRYNFLIKSDDAKNFDIFGYDLPDDKVGYVSTDNGYRLHQAVSTFTDGTGPVVLNGKDTKAFHMDFVSNQNVPYSEVTSNAVIHFYMTGNGLEKATFQY